MPALILAFDGVLADTLPLRAHALREACTAEGLTPSVDAITDLLPGLTFAEAAGALAEGHPDPTIADLIALRAQRAYGALVAHGVPLNAASVRAMHDASARGTRLALRADSERRHVVPLLTLAGLEYLVGVLRCSDDLPRGPQPSLVRSWTVLDKRLDRLAIDVPARTAWEAAPWPAVVAQPYVAEVGIGLTWAPTRPGPL
ncbi:MAG: hypothetical protein ACK6DP_16140 [Gemmatimonas sp.]|uniref:hypothetical protein n=1 Tax=Gemmatimonas sp. TaxID=1962908 RepID=UPI00391F036E